MAELDPSKTYLKWQGSEFPNSSSAMFKAPAGSFIDWGDGTVETFETASTEVNTHTYTDGIADHVIAISGLSTIESNSFNNCTSLKGLIIGSSVTIIRSYSFSTCNALNSVTISNSVNTIGSNAFMNCYSLNSVYISDISSFLSISFGSNSSNPLYWGKNLYIDNQLVASLTIPDSVTSIGGYAFSGCRSLTSVTIPDSVTSIGNYAFAGCTNLKIIVSFPSVPPTFGTSAIPTTVSHIYVQQSSKEEYKTATNWIPFAEKIKSNNIYLSLIRFNQKNKAYIAEKLNEEREYIKESIDSAITGDPEWLSKVYPIGSIYVSADSTSPASLFGGTWAKLEGKFLLGANSSYTLGSTGGEAAHTLTVDEMPSHTHTFSKTPTFGAKGDWDGGCQTMYDGESFYKGSIELSINATGGGGAHNNMPPYLAVNIWKRTA